jgi:enterochelin esterase-like enzyme
MVLATGVMVLIAGCNPTDAPPSPTVDLSTPTPTLQINTAIPTLDIPTEEVPPCEETQGQITREVLESTIVGGFVSYRIYLPPCYASTGRRYPVLYMLHGWGEGMDDSQWDNLGLDEAADLGFMRGSLPPMIIVMPNGLDAFHGEPDSAFPEVIVQELVPQIDATYCTWNERVGRSIGGLSRGGMWAICTAFNNPQMFNRVGGHSPVFQDPEAPIEQNPLLIVDTADRIEALEMYFDVGAGDFAVDPPLQEFVAKLHARGIEPTYVINPFGDHSDTYWVNHTADYLAFYAANWPRDVSQFPGCEPPSIP